MDISNPFLDKLRRHKLSALLAFTAAGVLLATFSWFYGHSMITFEAPPNLSGNITYELVNQTDSSKISYETNEKLFKKRVKKGAYEVKALSDNKTYFEILKTKPFMGSSLVQTVLTSERNREFIGNNPGSCIYYDGRQSMSYDCNGDYSSVVGHLPASEKSPTSTQNDGEDLAELEIGGIISFQGKKLVYAQGFTDLESTTPEAVLYEINETATPLKTYPLQLNASGPHKIANFKDGFIVYNNDFSKINYYRGLGEEPTLIDIDRLDGKNLEPVELEVLGDNIAIIHSDIKLAEKADPDSSFIGGKTVVQVLSSGQANSYEFNEGFTSIKLCSKNLLCFLNGRILSVYELADDKKTLRFKMVDVHNVLFVDNQLVVERSNEVVGLSPDSKKGFTHYSFGDYKSCGLSGVQTKGYAMCVTNNKNDRSLLHLDSSSENRNSIDKKVLHLLQQPFIDNVSAYGSFIHISPNVGELVYSPTTKGYGFDPAIKQKTNIQINDVIKEINIDTSVYRIINTRP